MKTSPAFFFPQSWNAQDLANAVPLRLSEIVDFDLQRDGVRLLGASNAALLHPRRQRAYVGTPSFAPRFDIC